MYDFEVTPFNGTVELEVSPTEVTADGQSNATVNATVKVGQQNAADGVRVFFSVSSGNGTLTPDNATTVNGVAQVTYTSSTRAGTETLEGQVGPKSGSADLTLVSGPPAKIFLSSGKDKLLNNFEDSVVVQARVTDQHNNTVMDYNNTVSFSSNATNATNLADFAGNATVEAVNGTAEASLNSTQPKSDIGKVEITASSANLTNGTLEIDVFTLDKLEIEANATTVKVDGTLQFNATGTFKLPGSGGNQTTRKEGLTQNATWKSSDEEVGTIDDKGVFTAKAPGSTNATAEYLDQTSEEVTIEVLSKSKVLDHIVVKTTAGGLVNSKTPKVGQTVQFQAIGKYKIPGGEVNATLDEDLSQNATWASSDKKVGTIDSKGLFTARAKGTTKVSATLNDIESAPLTITAGEAAEVLFDTAKLPDSIPAKRQVDFRASISGGTGAGFTFAITSQPAGNAGNIKSDTGIFSVNQKLPFAGAYVIEGTDINSGTSVTHSVKVPLQLQPNSTNISADAGSQTFQIQGAPAGTEFNATLVDMKGERLADPSNYGKLGDVNSTGHFTFTPNTDAAQNLSFKFKIIAKDPELAEVGLDELMSGVIRVIHLVEFSGFIEGAAAGALNGADVSVVLPEMFTQSTKTDAKGKFAFELPKGNTYVFQASKEGYRPVRFSSEDLKTNKTVTLDLADTYVAGTVTQNGGSFNGTASVYVTYEDAGIPQIIPASGRPVLTNEKGGYRIDFNDPGAVATSYRVIATRPGYSGDTTVKADSLPADNVTVDMNGTTLSDPVLGGTFAIKDDNNVQVGQVHIPPAASKGADFQVQTKGLPNTEKGFEASGELLFVVNATDTNNKPVKTFDQFIQITLPFDLGVVEPGQFEDGTYQVFHADTQAELLAGNGTAVEPSDILAVDYLGDGIYGFVTFQVNSLSVFGIDTSAGAVTSKGDDDDNCFIATAAFGSLLQPQVQVLRDFRDEYLMTGTVGRAFVDTYYTYSPPLADFIAEHELLRVLVRWSLLPLIGLSWIALQAGPLLAILALFGSLALISSAPVILIRSRREARG